MLVIGLTGGIATGKSTVATMLAAPPYSLPTVDADVLARQAVEPGTTGYRQVVRLFGASTPDLLVPESAAMPEHGPDGRGRPLNRAALGRRVFGTGAAQTHDRRALNRIVHPAVKRAIAAAVTRCYLVGHWAVVVEAPLLFEGGLDIGCGAVVVVAVADEGVQLRRLLARNPNLTPADAEDRVRSQAAMSAKSRWCEARGPQRGIVVWNDGSRENLCAAVDSAVARLRSRHAGWWTMLMLALPPLAIMAAAVAVCRNVLARRHLRLN